MISTINLAHDAFVKRRAGLILQTGSSSGGNQLNKPRPNPHISDWGKHSVKIVHRKTFSASKLSFKFTDIFFNLKTQCKT